MMERTAHAHTHARAQVDPHISTSASASAHGGEDRAAHASLTKRSRRDGSQAALYCIKECKRVSAVLVTANMRAYTCTAASKAYCAASVHALYVTLSDCQEGLFVTCLQSLAA